MDLSVIIVSYNARADLERCLRSLHDNAPTVSHEIIVVDNASTDGSAAAARNSADVRVIELDSNRGYAAANNVGIRASSGTHLLLLNSDTIVPPGAVDTLMRELVAHPDAAVAGPRLVDGDGRAELSFGQMISPLAEWRQRSLTGLSAQRDPSVLARIDAMTRQVRWPDWVTGACLLVRRADADAVGLLDERYFMYAEDVDFCAAIRARGRRILFTPAAEVVHLRGRSAATAPRATDAAYRKSQIAFYEKHHPFWAPLVKAYVRLFRPT
jgi:GT2 family glycosyltransferase